MARGRASGRSGCGGRFPSRRLSFGGKASKDGGEDCREFVRACASGSVAPMPSLLLTSAMGEARTVSDPAGNRKLSKGLEGGRRLRARDDAAAAAILAVALGVRHFKGKSREGSGVYLGAVGS